MRVTFWHKKIEIFSISKCIYCPLSRINTAFLVVSFYDFNTFFNNRYWKLKLNILNPISIFPSFREYINAFNKSLHELFLFSIRTF